MDKTQHKMEFNELMPGSTVRFIVKDGVQYLSIRDLIIVVCDLDARNSMKPWNRLSEKYKDELRTDCTEVKFKGRGEAVQPVITFQGAIKLMMWLGGDKAKSFRSKVTEILTKYFAGDKSLLRDLHANAESNAPINQAARAALNNPVPAQPSLDEDGQGLSKRQRIDEDRAYAAVLREANPHFERRLELQVQFVDIRERWLAVDFKGEKDRLELQRMQNDIELETQKKRDEIELEKEKKKNDLEYEKQQNMLHFERSKLTIAKEGHLEELEYKRALKALDAPPAAAAVPAAVPAARDLLTVLKVYLNNKEAFGLLKPEQRKGFLMKAGHAAAQAYALQYGVMPSKLEEHGYDVNAFPEYAESVVMDALRTAYRESTVGIKQTTLDASFFRQGQGFA